MLFLYTSDDENEIHRGRKQRRNLSSHKKVIRKKLRECGQAYMSSRGKPVQAREITNKSCGCSKDCNSLIPWERLLEIYQHFYTLDWSLKNAFIMGSITVSAVQRHRIKAEESRRSKSRIYKFQDASGEDQIICKKFYRETLCIADGTIDLALKRKQETGLPAPDGRGKHTPHNKTPKSSEENVLKFIDSFPTYHSHYSRKENINRKYLPPDLNMSKMYEMYVQKCQNEKDTPVSLFVFRNIFNSKRNLHFHLPHKDTCQTCDAFAAELKGMEDGPEKAKKNAQHELHLCKADAARASLKNDVDIAKQSNGTRAVLTFDLQKTLPTPVLSTGVAYYKRQLWTYNLGIHDEVNNIGFMYVWSEETASRGPQEIASCIMTHLQKKLPSSVTHVILYSDSCGGQNRNIKMTLMLSYMLQNSPVFQVIEQKFFIPGHSFNSCDSDFAIIERAKKYHPDVYTPENWLTVIASAKKKKPNFYVTHMDRSMFFSCNQLQKEITNRKTCNNGTKVEWFQIRHIVLRKEKVLQFPAFYNFLELIPVTVDLRKKRVGRPSGLRGTLPLLYPEGHKISSAKKKDLLDLLKYIPPVYHEFYRSLATEES